jgi:hypothetical protein
VAVAIFVALGVLAIVLPKDQGRRLQLEPTGTGAPQTVESVEREVPVTRVQRDAVNRTLVAFIRTAVTRADPAAAWELTTRQMRSGVTRAEWNSGVLPVVPYPAQVPERPEWNVITSYPGDVVIDLLLQPRRGSTRGPIAFAVELMRSRDGRWLVDSMVPEHVFSPVGQGKPPKASPNAKPEYPKGRLSPLWFVIPGVLLALAILTPLSFALASWRRNRAIARRYRESLKNR